jgi:hypothetical protein
MTTSTDGKARLDSAKRLAKAGGVKVLGWNDKPGKEFISLQGEGDKLEALRKELEKVGWHAWPMDEGQEGHFMDFGMQPPPARSPADQSGMTAVDLPSDALADSNYFHYRGPGSLYLNQFLAFSFFAVLLWMTRAKVLTASLAEGMVLCCVAIALILLPFHWVDISGDETNLIVRKHFFGARRVVAFSNIKQAKVYKQQVSSRGRKLRNRFTWFLAVNVISGKSFDLFLPKQKLADLAAFIQRRIAA